MFMQHKDIAPDRAAHLLARAEAAARAIPPAFPLDATVAVNPFLGQTEEDLATAAARLARVAGVRVTGARADFAAQVRAGEITDDDLVAALWASDSPLKPADLALLKARIATESPAPAPLPTLADLAAEGHGHRLARRHRAHVRALGGGAFRPRAGALDARAGARGLCRVARMGDA